MSGTNEKPITEKPDVQRLIGQVVKLQIGNKQQADFMALAKEEMDALQADLKRAAKQIDEKNKEIERLVTGETLAHFEIKQLEGKVISYRYLYDRALDFIREHDLGDEFDKALKGISND